MNKNIKVTIAISILTLMFPQIVFAGCTGNACADVTMTRINGCVHVINNNSERRIKISTGAWGHSPTLYPGEQKKILTFKGAADRTGECMKNINNWKANYK